MSSKSPTLEAAKSKAAGTRQADSMAADEQRRIGGAARAKERREADAAVLAVLKSAASGGTATYWQRRVTAETNADTDSGRRTRPTVMVERAGAYRESAFLAMAETAAGKAARGTWRRPEAIEAVTAELAARTLTRTAGRPPRVGSLPGPAEQTDPARRDLAYLIGAARYVMAAADRGDREAAGLAAEVGTASLDGMAAEARDSALDGMTLGERAAEAEAQAEGRRDGYLAESDADLLNDESRTAAESLAAVNGQRPAAALAAIASALRGGDHGPAKSADLAPAYGRTAGAVRKAATNGRRILAAALTLTPGGPARWTERDWRALAAVAEVAAAEKRPPSPRHPMEGNGPDAYHPPKLDWPTRHPEAAEPVSYRATAPDWRSA